MTTNIYVYISIFTFKRQKQKNKRWKEWQNKKKDTEIKRRKNCSKIRIESQWIIFSREIYQYVWEIYLCFRFFIFLFSDLVFLFWFQNFLADKQKYGYVKYLDYRMLHRTNFICENTIFSEIERVNFEQTEYLKSGRNWDQKTFYKTFQKSQFWEQKKYIRSNRPVHWFFYI